MGKDMRYTVDEVFIGTVRLLSADGERSGIFKAPADGPVMLTPTGLAGDEQADLRHHGGPDKALHHFPVEHYALLAAEWPHCADSVGAGFLGENLSTHGLTEHELCIGDVLSIGAARVQVSQTRSPCWKIDLRVKAEGASRFVEAAGITGWYYRVLQPGLIGAGDVLELIERPNPWLSLAHYWESVTAHRPDPGMLRRIAMAPGLAADKAKRWAERADWLESASA
jgi:MOSC domain-containing protein YiiM